MPSSSAARTDSAWAPDRWQSPSGPSNRRVCLTNSDGSGRPCLWACRSAIWADDCLRQSRRDRACRCRTKRRRLPATCVSRFEWWHPASWAWADSWAGCYDWSRDDKDHSDQRWRNVHLRVELKDANPVESPAAPRGSSTRAARVNSGSLEQASDVSPVSCESACSLSLPWLSPALCWACWGRSRREVS